MTRAAPALLLAGLLCGCAALQGEHEPGADAAAPAAAAASPGAGRR